MKRVLTVMLLGLFCFSAYAQDIKSPDEFLGYKLGSQFTYHHIMADYFNYVAESSPKVVLVNYGNSIEGRPLLVVFVSSEENINKLETIRTNNLKTIGLMDGTPGEDNKPFVWLSYNVHGNESVGMEASMKTLHSIVTGLHKDSEEWLKECIVVIDPCQNPDGRDLYTNRYRNRQPVEVNHDDDDWSHSQPWPSARLNHYLFDLNRDWAWHTQAETRQRLELYKKYMPQVHADFHEMGSESTFFFAPGADPWHKVITPWQHEFHKLTGQNNAGLFDEKYRLYFTKESFDLFCPSFGDTWPLFNGAMGFTYEQGGGGSAGIAVETSTGDTLTLEKRIEGHYLSSLATIKTSYEVREKLLSEFKKFFRSGETNPEFEYKSILIKKSNNTDDIISLLSLLDDNQIKYSQISESGKEYEGFDYLANNTGKTKVEEGDILVSAFQPQSHLVEVLFEPDSKFTDSLSYDLTGWALPYLYNIKAYALKEKIKPGKSDIDFGFKKAEVPGKEVYAYLIDWNGFGELKLMAELYRKKFNIRYALKPFTIGSKEYKRGSLIISRGDNLHLKDKFDSMVIEAANRLGIVANIATTGLVDKGIDMGSNYASLKKAPKIALIGGSGTSTGSFGELWYFFEQELKYPVTIIESTAINSADLGKFDVIYLPSGSYTSEKNKLNEYLKEGGRLITFERAVSLFAGEKSTNLYSVIEKKKKEKEAEDKKKKTDDSSLLKKYENQRREGLKSRSASSIYRVKIDNTHPYTYGMGAEWFIIKRNQGYPYLSSGNNIAYITDNEPVSGFAGKEFIENIGNTLVIGSERIGRGEVVYITDDPYYRAFWKSGRVLLGNLAFR